MKRTPPANEIWLYSQPQQTTCLVDKESGGITANIYKVEIGSILYATSYNVRKGFLKIVCKDNTYYRKITLKELEQSTNGLIFTSKDTLINSVHVTSRCDWFFLWISEHQFKISRRYRQSVIDSFNTTVL